MLIHSFNSFQRNLIFRVLPALMVLFFSTSCSAQQEVKCSGHILMPTCVLTSDEYMGFIIGMSKVEALENACNMEQEGKLRDPVFFINEKLEAFPNVSICALGEEAEAATWWSFIDYRYLRERSILIKFKDAKISSIRVRPTGWVP
jgi:hypothetical protein